MQYWIKLGFPKRKLLLRVATFGRSFTLSDPASHGVGSFSRSPGLAGEYTNEAGLLSYYEVTR